ARAVPTDCGNELRGGLPASASGRDPAVGRRSQPGRGRARLAARAQPRGRAPRDLRVLPRLGRNAAGRSESGPPVEISAPELRSQPSRTVLLVVCGIAGLGLVLLVVVAAALISKPSTADAKRAPGKPRAPGRPEPKLPTLTRAQTKVIVLNANGITGAAAAEASRARARGYRISRTG